MRGKNRIKVKKNKMKNKTQGTRLEKLMTLIVNQYVGEKMAKQKKGLSYKKGGNETAADLKNITNENSKLSLLRRYAVA